jgi:hypothetical protein
MNIFSFGTPAPQENINAKPSTDFKFQFGGSSGFGAEKKDEKSNSTDVAAADDESLPSSLTDYFANLFNKPELADVQFKLGTHPPIHAHRLVLAAHSPAFEGMLYPVNWDDAAAEQNRIKRTEPVVIEIKDAKYDVFFQFIRCIYTDKLETIDQSNIHELIRLARRYGIVKVNLLCSEYMESDLTVQNACDMFELACGLLNDQMFGIHFIEENIEEISNTQGWLNMSQSRLKTILNDNKLACEEFILYEGILKWGKNQLQKQGKTMNNNELKAILADLLPTIRFPLMSLEEIASVVAPSQLLEQQDLLKLFQYLSINDEKQREFFQLPFKMTPREGGNVLKDSKVVDKKFKKDLLKLFDNKKQSFELLWRGSRDGFNGASFHTKCDAKGPTLTTCKGTTGHVFGGYNSESWSQSGRILNCTQSFLAFLLVPFLTDPLQLCDIC